MALPHEEPGTAEASPRDQGDPISARSHADETSLYDRRAAKPRDTTNETAQRLLYAARYLLERNGVNSLSVDAIARKAGVNKPLIYYYFGSKGGLLAALMDSFFKDELAALDRFYEALPEGEERVHAVAQGHKEMLADLHAYHVYLDLAVYMLRAPRDRASLAGAMSTYRQLNAWGLGSADDIPEDIRALSAITLALSDGLALQTLADSASVDMDRIWKLWEEFADSVIDRLD